VLIDLKKRVVVCSAYHLYKYPVPEIDRGLALVARVLD
jgi:hypothetical protein